MRYLIIILSIILLHNPCFAIMSPNKLSLNDAIKLAVEKNVDLQKSRKDVEIAQNNIKVANRLQNPKVETMFLFGRAMYGEPRSVGLALPVEIMKRGARKSKAISEKGVVISSVNADEFNVKMNVRDAYIRLAAAKSILKVVERQQDVLEDMVAVAKKRYKDDEVQDIEIKQAELILKQFETTLYKAKTQVETQRYYFNRVLNIDDEADYDIEEDSLPSKGDFLKLATPLPSSSSIPYSEIEKLALEHRYDVIIAKKEIDVAKNNLKVVLRQRIPDVTVQGGYTYLTAEQNRGRDMTGALSGGYVGGSVDLPVLYRFKPEIDNAKLELEKRELAYLSVKNAAIQDVKKAYAQFELARRNLNYYTEELLESSDDTLTSVQNDYAKADSDLSNLVLTSRSHLDLMMDYTNALADYYVEWIELLSELNIENIDSL